MISFKETKNSVYDNELVMTFIAFLIGVSVPLRASGVAAQQAAMGLALLAVLVVLSMTPAARSRAREALFSQLGGAVAFVFLAWGMGLFFSFDPYASLKVYARTGVFIVGAVLIWAALSTHTKIQGLMWKSLVVSSLVLTVFVLLSLNGVPLILSALKGQMLDQEVPYQAFKPFSTTAMCLIPVIIWAGRKLGGMWLWAGYAFAPMAVIVMLQTSNRSALAGTMVMALLFAILFIRMRKKYSLPVLIVAVVFVAAILSLIVFKEFENARQMSSVSTIQTAHLYLPETLIDSHRQYIWKFVFERFLEHPWLGNGIDQINKLPNAELKIPYMNGFAPWVPSHPHSWVMEILAETGVIGFIPMVVALAMTAWGLFRRYQKTHDESVLAQILLMGGFWFSALFNFSFWATWWQLTFVVLFAMLSATREQKANTY